MTDPNRQLQAELQDSVKRAFSNHRPLLTHLNADTSWLLQLPYPLEATPAEGRSSYNILLDPWLDGSQSDIASWFSTQWHVIPSVVKDIDELQARLKSIEELISKRSDTSLEPSGRSEEVKGHIKPNVRNHIDAVAISHEFTDHCHRATLIQLPPTTLIIAPPSAVKLIKSWNYFNLSNVVTAPALTQACGEWPESRSPLLPSWISIMRLTSTFDDFHSALLVAFHTSSFNSEPVEAVIYTPHGVNIKHLRVLSSTKPPIQTVALLHGLHDIELGVFKQLNLGARNGLRAQRLCAAKYWIGTHDEEKTAKGVVAKLLKRKRLSVEEVLDMDRQRGEAGGSGVEDWNDMNFVNLGSGESLLLE